MNFSVIFTVFWCVFLALVEANFYLEIAKPSAVDTTELIEKMTNPDSSKKFVNSLGPLEDEKGQFYVTLYECRVINHRQYGYLINCYSLWMGKREIYETANFYTVSDLDLPHQYTVKIDDDIMPGKFPKVLTIGLKPPVYIQPHFKETPKDVSPIWNQVARFLRRVIDTEDRSEGSDMTILFRLFSLNSIGFYPGNDSPIPTYFERYVAVLQRLINASKYNKELGSSVVPGSPLRFQPRGSCECPPKSKSRSSSWSLCKAFCWSKKLSASGRRSIARSLSGGSRTKSHSSSDSDGGSPSRSRFPSTSKSKGKSKAGTLSDEEILEAAGLLVLKMFDPCFVRFVGDFDPKVSDNYCSIHCQFLSMTLQTLGHDLLEECHHLKRGWCSEQRICVCSPRRGNSQAGAVNLPLCNNLLRTHIYQQAAQKLSPRGS